MNDKEDTVLVIDPDEGYKEELRAFLSKQGHKVKTGNTACEAIKVIQREKVCLLIMEVELEDIAGDEVIPIIKEIVPKVPIIAMTQNNSQELEAKVRKQGIFYYHIKSFGLGDLTVAVRNAFKENKLWKKR